MILISIIKLANNKEIMGDYANTPIFNLAAWVITIVVSALSVLLLFLTLKDVIY